MKKTFALILALSITFLPSGKEAYASDDYDDFLIEEDISTSVKDQEESDISSTENLEDQDTLIKAYKNEEDTIESVDDFTISDENLEEKEKVSEKKEAAPKEEDFEVYFYEVFDLDQRVNSLVEENLKEEAENHGNLSENNLQDTNQSPKSGWVSDGENSFFYGKDGKPLKGLQEIDGKRYIFNKDTGRLEKDIFQNIGDTRYYADKDGVCRRIGRDYFNGNFSYVKENGLLSKGLTEVSKRHYFFDNFGNMMTDTNQNVGGQWRYFDFFGEGKKTNGSFRKGRYGDYYYFEDGKRAQGYQKIDGKLYYFDDRYYNKRRNFYGAYDFKAYYFDSNGVGKFQNNITKERTPSGTDGFKAGQSHDYGRKTPYYNQRDPRRANRIFARSNDNFASAACGSTAMAMALSRVKNDPGIYPTTVAKDAWYYTNGEGTEWEFVPDEAIRYGLKAHRVPINEKALIQALQEGPVVVRVSPGYFINAGHFMVIDSYRNGNFYINDPYYYENTNVGHPFSRIRADVTTAWLIKE
jgi:glucan-binding YG repeat protein